MTWAYRGRMGDLKSAKGEGSAAVVVVEMGDGADDGDAEWDVGRGQGVVGETGGGLDGGDVGGIES